MNAYCSILCLFFLFHECDTYTQINTCFLKSWHSSGVRVSAFAMRGMTLTLSWSLFMNSMSSGFRLKGRHKENIRTEWSQRVHSWQHLRSILLVHYIYEDESKVMQFSGSPAEGQPHQDIAHRPQQRQEPDERDFLSHTFFFCADDSLCHTPIGCSLWMNDSWDQCPVQQAVCSARCDNMM